MFPEKQKILKRYSSGFSLIELLVAMAVSLVLLGGVITIVVNSSSNHRELSKMSEQLENGRYAMQMLLDDVQHAGFYGAFYALTAPAAFPDPCDATLANLPAGMSLPLQGYDDEAIAAGTSPAPGCIADRLAGTDILVIRRASTSVTAPTPGRPYFQGLIGGISIQADTAGFTNYPDRDLNGDGNTDVRDVRNPRNYHVDIYYIRNTQPPALARRFLQIGGMSAPEPLVDGIIDMQIEYAFDSDDDGSTANDDDGNGAVDNAFIYETAPLPAEVGKWADMVGIRIHLLARNVDDTRGYVDQKTYTLGRDAAGNPKRVNPANAFKHHVFSSNARVNNVADRKDNPEWY